MPFVTLKKINDTKIILAYNWIRPSNLFSQPININGKNGLNFCFTDLICYIQIVYLKYWKQR